MKPGEGRVSAGGLTEGTVRAKVSKAFRYFCYTVWWSRLRPVREYIAARTPLLQPPVLVLSLPRSGSSWVGDVLGAAPDALYLHEPLTQTFRSGPTLVEPDDPAVAPVYRAAADDAFAGIPRFKPRCIRFPEQWALGQRRRRRVVIKEVNPLICEWVLRDYRPRVIFLVRHPAAVCLSYDRLGWFDLAEHQMASGEPDDTPWKRHGRRQGYIQQRALRALSGYAERMIVRYEDLCLRPVEVFRRLYDFAQLEWTDDTVRLIEAKSSGGDRNEAFATERDSRRMASAWQTEIGRRELDELMAGYAAFDLPWYDAGTREPVAAAQG